MIRISNFKFQISNFCQRQGGFTLIELLIVVTIIGVLSSILMSNFIGIRQRTRDGLRKSDLQSLRSTLEQYRADQGLYVRINTGEPPRLNQGVNADCPTSASLTGSSGSPTYMQKISCDPLDTTYFNRGNYYYYSADGISYYLIACLENSNDTQGVSFPSGIPAALSTVDGCTSGKYYVLRNP